ncbi:MAG: sn-glycerol-3-phosphate ABC transporter ATP-binding protein UgpC [Verrucomicrobia bacterium]|nr:sn-glycerol-3-phosphate ABC transporter ATP-binding protein UgpC [Verrucomicrobiota bacterium]
MAEVLLKNVGKVYSAEKGGRTYAVRDFNLEIQTGEFVVFLGPSGCGKSTTLRMIAGLEEISEGEIQIGGRVVNEVPPKDRDIAMVFQNYALYPHMSVFDNMAFGLKLRKMDPEEILRRVNEAAGILGLTDYLARKPRALSGGQRQRVAVGRAMVRQPKVFLFDEPLSNLDARMRLQMRGEITRLHQRLGVTMIYVTHDQVEAMTMGGRIVVMKDGRIQQVGPPLEVYKRPANTFVAGFLGNPPMNLLEGTLELDGGNKVFQEKGGPIRIPIEREAASLPAGKQVWLGVRPEHCVLVDSADSTKAGCFEVKLELIESTGSETLYYLNTGAHILMGKGRLHPQQSALGQSVLLKINFEELCLFDHTSGLRI